MKRTLLFLVTVALMLPATSDAFDGNRKGFVIGGGLGLAPLVRTSIDTPEFGSNDNSEVGGAAHLIIGYAWDEHNMLVYEGNVTAYTAEGFTGNEDIDVAQGFNGASWYHYFGPVGRSFYTVVGVGFYVRDIEDGPDFDPGGGYLLGVGYEFTRHLQVALQASGGRTSPDTSEGDFDYGHNHISALISAVAF